MLKVLHNHIYAHRLKAAFASSPVLLVYQMLDNVDTGVVKTALQSSMDKAQPGSGATVEAFRIRNCVADGTADEVLSSYFQASNLLVAWQGAPQPAAGGQATNAQQELMINRRSTLKDIVGGIRAGAGQSGGLQHDMLKAMLTTSLALPSTTPLALLACFYRKENVPLGNLRQWSKLDAHQVYGELLQQLESPAESLLQLDDAMEGLLATVDAAGGEGLVECLDFRSHQAAGDAPQELRTAS